MKGFTQMTISLAITAALSGTASADVLRPVDPSLKAGVEAKRAEPRAPKHEAAAIPNAEPAVTATSSTSSLSTMTAQLAASGSTLVAPVSISYAGSNVALSISDSGTGKGLQSTMSNGSGTGSAIIGSTPGYGSGVKGVNTGSNGPGATFQVTNSNNAYPAAYATTAGIGPAMYGVVTATDSDYPAVYGQNTLSAGYGIGVQGDGGYIGVYGNSPADYGVFGTSSTGIGVYAYSGSGDGLYANSSTGNGIYAYSGSGDGVQGWSSSGVAGVYGGNYGSGKGVYAYSNSGIAMYANSASGYGIWGQAHNQYGVIGEDSGSGVGVYGYSATGYAGYFNGPVAATGYNTVSDKNAKTDFKPINGTEILDLVSRLPITSWDYKTDLKHRHLGPMAQDFHAAFGLNGDDDTHINLGDIAGISLAAIKELNGQMRQKTDHLTARLDEVTRENAALRAQLLEQTKAMADMRSMAQVITARMTVLEHQRDLPVQAAAVVVHAGGEGASE